MSTNVLNQSNIKYYLDHQPKQFRIFDISYTTQVKKCLKNFKLENYNSYDNYADNNLADLKEFLTSLGSNSSDQIEILDNTIKKITEIVMSGYDERYTNYWLTIRVVPPTSRFDIPRWHCDGNYFHDGNKHSTEKFITKFVTVLKGPGTLFKKTTPKQRKEYNEIEEIEFKIRNERPGILNNVTDIEYRKSLSDKVKDIGVDFQVDKYQAAIFIGYHREVYREVCGIHSEPPISEPRMFLSIVPATKEDVEMHKKMTNYKLPIIQKGGYNYQKYLKYKNKYLELKNKIGGMMEEEENTFYIYTLGILNWGVLNTILKYWDDVFCAHICSLIPSRFTRIVIIHCDIFYTDATTSWTITREQAIKLFNWRTDDFLKDDRIRVSTFQYTPLNFDEIRRRIPYIIIDFAHAFRYTISLVTPITPAGSTRVNMHGESPLDLNILRFGYAGGGVIGYRNNYLEGIGNQQIGLTPLFRVNSNNTITTFINKLLDQRRFPELTLEELVEPIDRIAKIILDIRLKLSKIFRNKDGDYRRFDSIFDDQDGENFTRIWSFMKNEIINQIMNTERTEEEIISFFVELFKREYL